ncbi:unnamed protein product [Brachionus calyciflorus]|uniref:Uncharacterized protein n=1 Tax=Brachionus calyciflorus TaxID=104777 RepID=A0A813XHK4_9BILA|nr:unnamed protein product [Brachionus calyciflorus]
MDVIDELVNKYNFQPEFPLSLEQDDKQLATLKANKSRLETKCRWVVEVVNSFLKKSFKALDGVSNSELDHNLDDYRIAAAIINKYFLRLHSDNDSVEIARKMKKEEHEDIEKFSIKIPNESENFPEHFSIEIDHNNKFQDSKFSKEETHFPNLYLLDKNKNPNKFISNRYKSEFIHYKEKNGDGYVTLIKNENSSLAKFRLIGKVSNHQDEKSFYEILSIKNSIKRSKRSLISHTYKHKIKKRNIPTELFDIPIKNKYSKVKSGSEFNGHSRVYNGGPLVLNVELLTVLDQSIYNYYKRLGNSNDHDLILENIRVYYAFVINSVNQKYQNTLSSDPDLRINIRLTNIIVCVSDSDSYWTDQKYAGHSTFTNYGDREVILILESYSLFGSFLESLKLPFEFDHAVGITKKDYWVKDYFVSLNVLGTTLLGGVCQTDKKHSVVEDRDYNLVPYTIAHEIGHNLGSNHDGESRAESCSSTDNYILSTAPRFDRNFTNMQKFSPCSIAQFKKILLNADGSLNSYYKCLANEPKVSKYEIYDKSYLFGQLWNANDQCDFFGIQNATTDFTRRDEFCTDIACNHGYNILGIGPAFEGTQCGIGKMCINKQCVESPLAVKPLCSFEDQLIYNWMDPYWLFWSVSKTCLEYFRILENNKKSIYDYCVNGEGKNYCCESCTKFLESSCFDIQNNCPTDRTSCSKSGMNINCRKSCAFCNFEQLKCKNETFLCQNGGNCINVSSSSTEYFAMKCICQPGYAGEFCQEKTVYIKKDFTSSSFQQSTTRTTELTSSSTTTETTTSSAPKTTTSTTTETTTSTTTETTTSTTTETTTSTTTETTTSTTTETTTSTTTETTTSSTMVSRTLYSTTSQLSRSSLTNSLIILSASSKSTVNQKTTWMPKPTTKLITTKIKTIATTLRPKYQITTKKIQTTKKSQTTKKTQTTKKLITTIKKNKKPKIKLY